ncbi:flavin reductase family protein [Treponema sp. J25]|uniref:flavin reductase family protein n=1 Tax=Treponema sp. J25 TaxID=2094121 RepID=UPI00104EC54D|nr:flavin reductase family protein [Treponema sp. J25]TCW61861.1 flavin reductase family protein [Treponema sp. J25]
MDYHSIPPEKAYTLLNPGGIVFVCTRNALGIDNLAPIAWSCPLDYEPVSRVLLVLDPGHATTLNIEYQKEFALALPTYNQKQLVEQTGSVSGKTVDKYDRFDIPTVRGEKVQIRLPADAAAYLECRLLQIQQIGSIAVVAGEVLCARAVKDAWKLRLHYAGDGLYYRPGEEV